MEAAASSGLTPCDICGETEAFDLPEAARYGSGGVSVCARCGFVHVKQRRSAREIAGSWEKIYAAAGYTARWPAVEARLTYVAEWFDQHSGWDAGWEGKSVLEIGAGEGRLLEMVRQRGAHPVALEPTAEACRALRAKDIFAHQGTIEECGRVGTFDVVVIAWTLENCADCIGMLRAARSMLGPGGRVLVATGSRILVPYKKPISTYFSQNPPDCHAFRFSANSLRNAAARAGLGADVMNDYRQSDWMVAAFSPTDGKAPPIFDGPRDVLDFFRDWARAFP